MAITQRTAVESTQAVATAIITVTKPTGLADGDFAIIAVATNGGTLSSFPSGFTIIGSETTQTNPRLHVYGKYITNAAGEPQWDVTTTAVTKSAIAQAFIGVDSVTQIDVAAVKATGATGSNLMTNAEVVTATNNALLIYVGTINASGTVLTADALMTPILETTAVKRMEMDYEARPTAGATGSRTMVAASGALAWGSMMFALRSSGETPVSSGGAGRTPVFASRWVRG